MTLTFSDLAGLYNRELAGQKIKSFREGKDHCFQEELSPNEFLTRCTTLSVTSLLSMLKKQGIDIFLNFDSVSCPTAYYPIGKSFIKIKKESDTTSYFFFDKISAQCGIRTLSCYPHFHPELYYDYICSSVKEFLTKFYIIYLVYVLKLLEETKSGLIYIASDVYHSPWDEIFRMFSKPHCTTKNPNSGSIIDYYLLNPSIIFKPKNQDTNYE